MIRAILIVFISLVAELGFTDDQSFFAARREELMRRIEGAVAVLQGAPDTRAYTSFRQDNNFYYLTGVTTPSALLLIDGAERRSILFLPPRNERIEKWEGPRLFPGPEAVSATGMDDVLELKRFGEELEKRTAKLRILYTPFSPHETAATSRDRALQYATAQRANPWDGRQDREEIFRKRLNERLGPSVSIRDLSPILDDMRRIKDAQEIERLRRAGRLSALGLKEAMRAAKPGMYEYQLAAVAEMVFRWHGAQGVAFSAIVGSGPNSCVVHYDANTRKMEANEIVVMDFGADYRYYQSDITRTFPVSGKFSEEQAEVYAAVLSAQKAAIARVRPGATFSILEETVQEILERFGYAKYVMHGVSHYVGMSIHDVGKPARFEPGVVIAVEPGVYIPEKNLGIRIEDTVVVTRDGCEVLTADAPKEIVEIEKLMSETGIGEAIRD